MPTTINGTTGVSLVANNATINTPAISGGTITSATLVTPTISGTVTGLTAASMPAGSVVQVVRVGYGTYVTYGSTTYNDTGLTASITPSSSSNKILVIVNMTGVGKSGGNTSAAFKLVRGSTDIMQIDSIAAYTNNTSTNYAGGTGGTYLDSPATTSSTTYKVQWSNVLGVGTIYLNDYPTGSGGTSTITLMEIKG